MEANIFGNPHIGLEPTLFYNIDIFVEPFRLDQDALDMEFENEVDSNFSLEFIQLDVKDWRNLDGETFYLKPDDVDGSLYISYAHNPVDIQQITFREKSKNHFIIDCVLFIDFEFEDSGYQNTTVAFKDLPLQFEGLRIDVELVNPPEWNSETAQTFAKDFVNLQAYEKPSINSKVLFNPFLE
ncbi:MAG: hypothetical protein ACR2F2_14200 [Pyrinomonadaceae bacterium]